MATTRTRLAAIAGAGALAISGTISALTPALAQDTTQTPAPDRQTTREQRKEEHQAAFATALAEELGLDVERVRTALDNVRAEMRAEAKQRRLAALKVRLDNAVADGRLTQEQADAIYAAAESGAMPFGGPRGRRGHHGPRGDGSGAPERGEKPAAGASPA